MPNIYHVKILVDQEAMARSIAKIQDGQVYIRKASVEFQISFDTIQRHLASLRAERPLAPVGHLPILAKDVEVKIGFMARTASSNGFDLLKCELKLFIVDFVQTNWHADTDVGIYLRPNCVSRHVTK
jgi:hypothetical protein